MYYSASMLVRQGHAAQLYTGADTGTDPQKVIAAPGSPLFEVAHAQGLPFVGLYVYPPVLADLLLPLTWTDVHTATQLWLAINVVFLLLTALCVCRLLGVPLLSGWAALVLASLFCFTPVLQCLVDGQITIFLLLLWAAGMVLYQDEHTEASALVFALAAAIKLTPAIVILPFLLWRRWRFLAAFALAGTALVLLTLWVNTPHALLVYGTRVLPSMSGAIPYITNFSFPAATQRFLTLLRAGAVSAFPDNLPAGVALAGRAASACLLLGLLGLIARARRFTGRAEQVLILGLLGLMAPIVSPVSWFHAYATAFVAFALLWRECFRRSVSTGYLLALTVVSLLLGSAVSENLMTALVNTPRYAALATVVQIGQLLAAAALVYHRVWRLGASAQKPSSESTHAPSPPAALPV